MLCCRPLAKALGFISGKPAPPLCYTVAVFASSIHSDQPRALARNNPYAREPESASGRPWMAS